MMATDGVSLSIIIPSYQEEENLRLILPRLITTVAKMQIGGEILVVDTTTPRDNTAQVCKELGVRYISRRGGEDYAFAIETGISEARGEYVIMMDADGSHSPEFIETLYANRNMSDVVVASRYIAGGGTDNSAMLILMSRIVNAIYSIVLGINCRDVSNSFKLYRRRDLQELRLRSRNFDVIEEILFKLIKKKTELVILELPYTFKERMFGHTKRNLLKFIFSYGITILRLRFGK